MVIGDRLRELREAKNLSQTDIERITGLKRCYVSRVEHGHTVPSVETLRKFAHALETTMLQLLYEGEGPPGPPPRLFKNEPKLWGAKGEDAEMVAEFRKLLAKMSERDRQVLMDTAREMHNTARETHNARRRPQRD